MTLEEYKNGIAEAVEKDHPNCDCNHCDIDAALRAGFPLSSAHLLIGATECPALEKFIEENGPIPQGEHIGWPADFDEWVEWFKENTIECEACNSFNFTDEFTPTHCANCLKPLPEKHDSDDDEEGA